MLQRMLFHVGLPALVVGTLLSAAAPCQAQIGFGRGAGIGIGFGGYGGYPGGGGGYPMMGYGSGINFGRGGYNSYGYGYSNPGYGYRNSGYSYGNPGYGYSNPGYGYYQQPTYQYRSAYQPEPAPLTNRDVLLDVQVPNTAQVWVNGDLTTQTGMRREYITNDLTPGHTYTYSIKARWTENGKPVEHERKVKVHGGETMVVNFNLPS